MQQDTGERTVPIPAPFLAERAALTLERFLRVEAVSGAALLLAAIGALIWANAPSAPSYEAFWNAPLAVEFGTYALSEPLRFWINDGLMTIFFLVVGMEIRREIHEGALSSVRQAALPLAIAAGGIALPALIFLALNPAPEQRSGWAIPTATDIAFAVGVLALLGRRVPGNVRVVLLALAIVDDLVAVLVIALFYSSGLSWSGFFVVGLGVLAVLGLQRAGVGSAWAYFPPGAIVWCGLLLAGVHPALAGVVLGLLTPIHSIWRRGVPELAVSRLAAELTAHDFDRIRDAHRLAAPLRRLGLALREVLPPAVRVQMALHPWVAYGVMPLFALANAGVVVEAGALGEESELRVAAGIVCALVLGKPLGIVGVAWCVVRLGWCRLPDGVGWRGIVLIGTLAGIGFTMSTFIAMLAYGDAKTLQAAKLGILFGSALAAVLGLGCGALGGGATRSGIRSCPIIDQKSALRATQDTCA